MQENEKTCPDCAESVKLAARICRFCGHEFANTSSELIGDDDLDTNVVRQGSTLNYDDKIFGKHTGSVFVSIFLIAMIALAYHFMKEDEVKEISALESMNGLEYDDSSENLKAPPSWQYDTSKDEVRNADIKTASIYSSNEALLAMPYSGGTRAQLVLRKHPEHGLDVMIQASPSQIVCDSYYGCSLDINIDGKSQKIRVATPADFDSEVLFAKDPRSLIPKIQKSKKIIVEIPFFSNGNHQFHFETSGLKWDEK